MKKKIKPSDLNLSPRPVGQVLTNMNYNEVPRESNNIHCTDSQQDLCLTDNTVCVRSDYDLCDTKDNNCNYTIACPQTQVGCVDSNSAAVQCCEHTGVDCVESGAACPGTYKNCNTDKTCTCPVYSDDCAITRNNICVDTNLCQTEGGLPCAITTDLDECPKTIRFCLSKDVCSTNDDCMETGSECMLTNDMCALNTSINCGGETDSCD